jgi:hypothetical protein
MTIFEIIGNVIVIICAIWWAIFVLINLYILWENRKFKKRDKRITDEARHNKKLIKS